MSLDTNLFTLYLTPNEEDPNVIDLIEPSGFVHYRKQRVKDEGQYRIEIYDPTTQTLLVTATAPHATSKVKVIELNNPAAVVEFRFTGTLSFKWGFKWEQHEFEWRREECFLLRKPDPAVLIAITKEQAGKALTVQILDYNLNRFDIDDRKGLEIVLLTALLTFQDYTEGHREVAASKSHKPPASATPQLTTTPPAVPPKPTLTGVDHIAEVHAVRGDINEVTVDGEGNVEDYAQYCSNLLADDTMLFISIASGAPEYVPKVLQVVEETKRERYKAGACLDDDDLHQYVQYDVKFTTDEKRRRRINLDDEPPVEKGKYVPPQNLLAHLSKIPMPELQPKAHRTTVKKSGWCCTRT
ncbi:hypothetical protein FISHEDRAFT_50295 [Fistulina hepatica ATCC 64428]|uniref:Uncharacterized protein n=1 Tax=Fistulina hepatica ATCC 64428 TaxID=1128425 RepID=A0A0D7A2S2_9AGAR|nr:hypothetical protein FISHEDRAFT_50295 [Fistulina hepatica ATCC 64428]